MSKRSNVKTRATEAVEMFCTAFGQLSHAAKRYLAAEFLIFHLSGRVEAMEGMRANQDITKKRRRNAGKKTSGNKKGNPLSRL